VRFPHLATLAFVALLAPAGLADLITGKVVDGNGVGIAGVNIDAKNLTTGDDAVLFDDGTNLDGFFSTTIPPGIYLITFNPPPPPASTSLLVEVDDVVVVGTKAMGVITLPDGVALSGHLQTGAGLPVANVNIDVVELSTGENVDLLNDKSDAFGDFLFAAPAGDIELRFNTKPVVGPTLAPEMLTLTLTGATDVGTVVFQPGFHVTGQVKRTNGLPVVNADTDTKDTVTGDELYTPGDNSDESGLFDVIVPAGTFDFEVCPAFADQLVATTIENLVVAADVNLGVITLANGVTLSGTVKNGLAAPLGNVDVDVRDSTTGVGVTLCSDNTSGAGTYAVVVPTGTFDVTFTPPQNLPYSALTIENVVVSGATILNGTLLDCPFPFNYGAGLAGTGGVVPTIAASGGAPYIGNANWTIDMGNARGGSFGTLVLGFGPTALPLKGGTLLVNIVGPSFLIGLPMIGAPGVAGAGGFSLNLPIPDSPAAVGLGFNAQLIVSDPAGPQGFAFSDGLDVTFCQ
jgi:hypothetical protein